jgi:hypothetical protein
MPDYQIYTNEAANTLAAEIIAALALSKLRLGQSTVTVNRFTTRTELRNAECNFDGYTAGGYALAAWTGPGSAPGGGAKITSPLKNIAYGPAADPPVTNEVGCWWVEDAAGLVRTVGVFDPPRLMQAVGDIIDFVDQMVIGKNPS